MNSTLVLRYFRDEAVCPMKVLLALIFLLPVMAFGQTESSSTQLGGLVVHGGDSELRGVIVHDAESMLRSIDKLAGELKGSPYPVVLELQPAVKGKPSAIVKKDFFQVSDAKKKYLLEVKMRLGQGDSFDQEALDRVLLEMFLMERSLRGFPAGESAARVEIRPWLLDGIGEALLWAEGKGDRRIYASLVESGGWMAVEKLVEEVSTAKMNVLSRELFRASSGALVMALLAQPEGDQSMGLYLSKVATFEGEHLTLLRTHFPQVNLGREGLERWWMLQVAAMSEAPLTEAMTIPETEAALKTALKLYFKSATGRSIEKSLDAWPEILKLETEEERVAVVRPASDLLTNLSYRCFPTYRRVLGAYLQALSDITKGESEDIEEIFTNLQTYRTAESERFTMVIDLLNYYHISTVQSETGEFEDYLSLKRAVESGSERKTDPLNRYLDNVQRIYERPGR
ncbi:hypothetical protein V2O64_09095 [Verrucomicrobiaceae bacterium 227]